MNNTIVYLTSKRNDGTMKENKTPHSQHIAKFLKHNNLSFENSFFMKQVHGNTISVIDDTSKNYIENVDGLVTKEKGKTLIVFTADCVPVVMYDQKEGIIGAAHAGYKGILLGVVEGLIEKMKERGSQTENISVCIGPSIRGCCYDVQKERVEQFEKKYPMFKNIISQKNKKHFLSLDNVVLQILLKNRIKQKNITVDPDCTSCLEDKYFSYRKNTKETYGEFITTITNI